MPFYNYFKWQFPLKIVLNFIFVLVFIFGCSDQKEERSLTEPSNQQLASSDFYIFASKLARLDVEDRMILIQQFISVNPISPIIESNNLAILYWYGKAESVLINGDIQKAWTEQDTMKSIHCGDSTFFYKIYSLPADTRVDYLLLVDGKETLDPRNPITTPSGYGKHSQLSMPLFKPDSIRNYRDNIKHGSLDSMVITSNILSPEKRSLKIYLPADYDSLNSLPVLFVNDGFKALSFNSYKNILDNLIAEKKMRPLITVFIKYEENDAGYFINNTEDYIKFLSEELVPFIDSKFKTSALPKDRAIAGISAGGHISLLTALLKPDVFSMGAGQSTTISDKLFKALDEIDKNKNSFVDNKIYFDVGRFDLATGSIASNDFLYSNQLFEEKIEETGLNYSFKIFNDGHQWANWRERIDDILIYFFGINL